MPLPLPGSPSSSWRLLLSRLRQPFAGASPSVLLAFWLFGLINNVLYVIILSAALDLVGPTIPKGVVLLCNVVPSLIAKLSWPYFIHLVPYPVRICGCVALSMLGMFLIASAPAGTHGAAIGIRMFGVILSSVSSGTGELSFLGLTHFYGPFSLAAWSSGTGGAGLVGAGLYSLATTTWGFGVKATLSAAVVLPLVMLASFFLVLPMGPLVQGLQTGDAYQIVASDEAEGDAGGQDDAEGEDEGLLGRSSSGVKAVGTASSSAWEGFIANLKRSRSLFVPLLVSPFLFLPKPFLTVYSMLPLLLVYIAEYSINQGVAPTLLFPLPETPFSRYRDFYPTYNTVYQVGVFISRSSHLFIRIHHLYAPTFLQILNLLLLTAHALTNFIPNVYIIFVIIFWEGLLGGAVYVSTFAEIAERVPKADREFSLGATTVSDSAGICIAGVVGMVLEVWLCGYQVRHGRDYCRRT